MRNGHLLIAKEKDPAAFIEFGPETDAPTGFGPESAREGGAPWPTGEGDQVFVPLAVWMPSVKLQAASQDFSDLEIGPDRRLYLLSDKSASIVRLGELVVNEWVARADQVWELPTLDGKPEGLALTRNGRAIVALDTKRASGNLVLLEPPIAEGAQVARGLSRRAHRARARTAGSGSAGRGSGGHRGRGQRRGDDPGAPR